MNLLFLMLDSFKNNGHCITMDSAYMDNIRAMIGCEHGGYSASQLYYSRICAGAIFMFPLFNSLTAR